MNGNKHTKAITRGTKQQANFVERVYTASMTMMMTNIIVATRNPKNMAIQPHTKHLVKNGKGGDEEYFFRNFRSDG